MENESITAQVKETVETGVTASSSLAPDVEQNEQIMGSYFVTLRVNESIQWFKLPKELKSERKKRIGSTWVKGTKDILRGLSAEEEERYLPKMLGVSPTSDNWDAKVREYWANMTIDVPIKGLKLDVGVESGYYNDVNEKGVRIRKKGLVPINLNDYINYNFCKGHKWVAVSREDINNVDFFPYFIEDHSKIKLDTEKAYIERKKAGAIYNRLIASNTEGSIDESKIDWILEVSKRNKQSAFYNRSYDTMTPVEKEMALEHEKNSNPDVFLRIATDPDLEDKSFISKLIEKGIWERQGNTYMDDSKILANSVKEAVTWLRNPVNSKMRITYEERLKGASM